MHGCEGGDVKQIWENIKAGKFEEAEDFFRKECTGHYIHEGLLPTLTCSKDAMNLALAEAEAPQVSIWDGIVMGGGVGLSIHGKYRVATENTVLLYTSPLIYILYAV